MTYFSQMAGLAVQNFVSAAVGMAVLAAVIRGFASRGVKELGNFWRDVTRTLLYILLPLAAIGTLILVSQGVIQTLGGYVTIHGLGGLDQTLAMGPAASQIAIKQIGTNGGGFFNVNSAVPVREPDAVLELRRGDLHPADSGRGHGAVRPHGRQSQAGLGALRDDGRLRDRAVRSRLRLRAARLSRAARRRREHRRRRRHHGRQPGGQGAAQRHHEQRALGRRHDRRLERLGQRGARFLHRIRQPRASYQHDDRGGDLRRGRLRAVRDALNGPPGGVHSRPHGGQDARVPREEGRVPRGQARS